MAFTSKWVLVNVGSEEGSARGGLEEVGSEKKVGSERRLVRRRLVRRRGWFKKIDLK